LIGIADEFWSNYVLASTSTTPSRDVSPAPIPIRVSHKSSYNNTAAPINPTSTIPAISITIAIAACPPASELALHAAIPAMLDRTLAFELAEPKTLAMLLGADRITPCAPLTVDVDAELANCRTSVVDAERADAKEERERWMCWLRVRRYRC
jgi:hypothetical protein